MKGTETVLVYRTARQDTLDDVDPAAGGPHHQIDNCIIVPRTSTELGKGEVIIDGQNVFAPAGSDVQADDEVEVRGVLYDVEGVPGDYRSARGKKKVLWVVLKRLGS